MTCLLAEAHRQAATDTDWQDTYRGRRPPVVRAVAWLVRTTPWLHNRAAVLNLRRLLNLGLTHTHNTRHLGLATE
ncbi:hypothetical protein ACFVZC_33555 [Streptomyces marokkonensis]|uniref:Transposase n=1 Tax=Streptomyces marokkonensis TaxID=324855 RepID=A0ABW6QGL5_9ACTN